MRRRRVVGDPTAVIADWVDQLANRFDYPDLDTVTGAVQVEGGGGAPTVVVAAVDAPDIEKGKADFVCTGADDQGALQAANDLMASVRGRLLLTSGSFTLSDTLTVSNGVTVEGMSRETYLFSSVADPVVDLGSLASLVKLQAESTVTDGTLIEARGGASAILRDLELYATGSAGVHVEKDGSGVLLVEQCWFGGSAIGIHSTGTAGRNLRVVGCTFDTNERGIWLETGDIYNIYIGYNIFESTDDWAVDVDGSDGIIIALNFVNSCGQTSNGGILATSTPGVIVVGNRVDSTRNGPSIELNGCDNSVVADNSITTGLLGPGILVDGCEYTTVADNTCLEIDQHGIAFASSNFCVATGNTVNAAGLEAADTYDGIQVNGNRNLVEANQIVAYADTRYGVNITGGECNMVVGNDIGDPDDYATDALGDTGANTQLFYPSDATYGDNFTDCGTGS